MTGERVNPTVLLLLGLTAVTFALYQTTFLSMVSVWLGSSTFLYGVLILPLSAYLIFRERGSWVPVSSGPAAMGLLALAVSVGVWLLATLVSVQVLGHFAFIGMLVAVMWSVAGSAAVRTIRFPLLYAFLAVPFGEFLIPPLMDWTAYSAVRALQLTGVPVLREGLYFSLPSGNFEVVEACSGIRFLLVTVVLGAYFAYETYSSKAKQFLFVCIAALVIVITNGVRAYVVVLIAHHTEMRYGTGQSHLIIGGIIFLTAITAMFWIGRKFEDKPAPRQTSGQGDRESTGVATGRLLVSGALVLALIVAGPLTLAVAAPEADEQLSQPRLPVARDGWSVRAQPVFDYAPDISGAASLLQASYWNSTGAVAVFVGFYAEQTQGNELIGWDTRPFNPYAWRDSEPETVTLEGVASRPIVNSVEIRRGGTHMLVWHWYDVGGVALDNPVRAKLEQAKNTLRGRNVGDAYVVLATNGSDGLERARDRLAAFAEAHFQNLSACLRPTGQVGCAAASGAE